MKFVSIITPTYNSSEFLLDTYESIRAQTYQQLEWIVTDDHSSDETWDILCNISSGDERVVIERNDENSGAAITRNKSLEKARGDYIAFLDSDDKWQPSKLEKQIFFMENSQVDFSFTAYELVNVNGRPTGKVVDSKQVGFFTYNDMLKKKATLGCSTVMLRSSAFDDISMPEIRTGQDYALWLKLLRSGTNAYILNEPLMQYRIVPGSISSNKLKKALRQWEIYRDIEGLGLARSLHNFGYYVWRAVFRKE